MKCISLWQPWASAVALGVKRIETRSWQTNHSGPIAIHAALKCTKELRETWEELTAEHHEIRRAFADSLDISFDCLPFGKIIAVGHLRCCMPVSLISKCLAEHEIALGDYRPGRFAWMLNNVRRLPNPIPCRGRQGLFNVPDGDMDDPKHPLN
jgi:hypothetical protein